MSIKLTDYINTNESEQILTYEDWFVIYLHDLLNNSKADGKLGEE